MRKTFRCVAAAVMAGGLMTQARSAPASKVGRIAVGSAAELCPAKASLPAAAKRFLLMQLALSPVEAGEAGLHIYQGRNLDRELDDFSPTELAAQHKLLLAGQQCFTRFDSRKLSAEDAVDLAMLRRTISDSLYRDTEVQDEHYRPDHYVELLGSALFFR
jgi:uncharacterized protein (DUF885 family)